MHLFHIPQCTIENRNVHISVLNGALWDMEQVFKMGLLLIRTNHAGNFSKKDLCLEINLKAGGYFKNAYELLNPRVH